MLAVSSHPTALQPPAARQTVASPAGSPSEWDLDAVMVKPEPSYSDLGEESYTFVAGAGMPWLALELHSLPAPRPGMLSGLNNVTELPSAYARQPGGASGLPPCVACCRILSGQSADSTWRAGKVEEDVAHAIAAAATSATASAALAGKLESWGVLDILGPGNPVCMYSAR